MNTIYSLVWNDLHHAWVAASEISKGQRPQATTSHTARPRFHHTPLRALVVALGLAGIVHAAPISSQLPTGGTVSSGQASISQSGLVTTVQQSTARAVIDWQTFNVGSAATVNFNQPSASSVTLNRVLDSNPSQIFGRVTANGQLFFSNPNGVYFSPTASVDVGGLVATTHGISNADFMAGNYRLSRDGATGSVVNEGHIQTALGGYVALLAPEVRNQGVIVAQMGTVALAAGDAYELQFDVQQKLASIRVEASTVRALVENGNAIHAPGGLIVLSAHAANQLQGSVVKNSGELSASSLVSKGGRIVLEGDDITLSGTSRTRAEGATGGGTVLVGGDWQGSGSTRQARHVTVEQGALIDVSATVNGDGGKAVVWSDIHDTGSQTRVHGTILAKGGAEGGHGGQVETSGHFLDVAGIRVNTSAAAGSAGNWLLDPYSITIAGSGASGTAFGSNYTANATSVILASDIANALGNGNVTVQTGGTDGDGQGSGDITVAANITKVSGGNTTLTLKAHRDIIQNANIAVSSSSGALNVIYNSDSDALNGGHIALNNGASINSNGGNITLGGGTDVTTGYATGSRVGGNFNRGVFLDAATLNANGGNILVRGKGWSGTGNTAPIGVDFSFGSSMLTTGAGTITIVGVGGSPTSGTSPGINMYQGGGTAATVRTQNGAITLTGTGGGNTALARNAGINYETGSSYIYSTGGAAITLNGTGDNTSVNSRGIAQANGGTLYLGWDGTIHYASNITLNANSMNLEGAHIKTTGTVTMNSTGTVSQTTSGSILASNLVLTGTGGAYTLTRAINNVATLAANTGSLSYTDADDLTIASVGGTSGLSASGAMNVTSTAGSIVVAQNISKSAGSDATLTLKARDNISVNSNVAISSSNNKLNVVFNADSDASGGGAIYMDTGSSIHSNGGNVTLGGGANPATTAAMGSSTYLNGIRLNGATIQAGSGNVSLRGEANSAGGNGVMLENNASVSTTSGNISMNGKGAGTGGGRIGVLVSASTVRTTAGGNIDITGQGSLSGTANNNEGVKLDNSSLVEVQSGTNRSLTLTGVGGTGVSYNIGVNVRGNSTVRMGSGVTGQMNITGTGGSCSNTGCWGVLAEGNGVYESLGAANILITGTTGTGADNYGIKHSGGNNRIGASSMTGDITLVADSMDLAGFSEQIQVRSSGVLTIKPKTANTTIGVAGGAGTLALAASYFSSNFADGFSKITIGSSTAGAITVGGNITLNDATTFVSGGNITLNGTLNGTGQRITLTGGSGATVSASGAIIADQLLLNGNGASYSLSTSTANAVNTLAASGIGAVDFTNSSALSIGTVDNVQGISSTGTVNVATLTGDLTVSQGVTTTDTSTNALTLAAGKNTAAGTATGGDIILSGSPNISTGSGGFAKFYTGSVGRSTGLADMVGRGSARFRYNSSAGSSNFTAPLQAGKNVIYREQPTVTVRAEDAIKAYDGSIYSGGYKTAYSGLVNGDDSSIFSGALSFGGGAQTATTAGSHAIALVGSQTNGLGYAIAYSNGTLTITPAADPPPAPPAPPAALPTPDKSPPPLLDTAPTAVPVVTPDAAPVNVQVQSAALAPGGSQGIVVSLVQNPSMTAAGVVTVALPKGTATSGQGFTFTLPDALFLSSPNGTQEPQVQVRTASGGDLPSWLRFVASTRSFVASAVPDGAFPVQLDISIGTQTTRVVISELDKS